MYEYVLTQNLQLSEYYKQSIIIMLFGEGVQRCHVISIIITDVS